MLFDAQNRILGEEGPGTKPNKVLSHLRRQSPLHWKFYRNERAGISSPLKKASTSTGHVQELKRVLDRDEDLILEWLRIGHVPEEVLRYQQAQEEAKKKNFRLVGEVDLEEVNNFRDRKMFDVRHQGGRDIVELNTAHPFVQSISEEELTNMEPAEIRGLFARLLAAFGRSRTLLLGGGASEPEILFEQSVFDWSEFTAEFVERK